MQQAGPKPLETNPRSNGAIAPSSESDPTEILIVLSS